MGLRNIYLGLLPNNVNLSRVILCRIQQSQVNGFRKVLTLLRICTIDHGKNMQRGGENDIRFAENKGKIAII